MLLGCCHCDEDVSSSSDVPSSSVPSDSSSSGPSFSGFPGSCGCDVLPSRWEVTVAGWDSIYPAHASCCQNRDGIYTLAKDTTPKSLGLAAYSECYSWSSSAIALNQNTATGTTPTCVEVGTRPRVIVYLALLQPAGVDAHIFVDVNNYVPGGFGGTYAGTRFRSAKITAQGQCLYPSVSFFANSDTRCTYGSVSLIPG